MSQRKNKQNVRVDPPGYIGSMGLLYVSPEKRLDNDLNVAVEKLLTQEIHDSMRKPNPRLDKMAKRMGKLYGSGADSSHVASRIVLKEDKRLRNEDDSVSSTVCSPLRNPKMYADPRELENKIDPNQILYTAKSTETPLKKQPLRSSDAVRLSEKKVGGAFHVPHAMKHIPYGEQLTSSPSRLSCVNNNSPRMWPNSTQYAPGSIPSKSPNMARTQQQQIHTHQKNLEKFSKTLPTDSNNKLSSNGKGDSVSLITPVSFVPIDLGAVNHKSEGHLRSQLPSLSGQSGVDDTSLTTESRLHALDFDSNFNTDSEIKAGSVVSGIYSKTKSHVVAVDHSNRFDKQGNVPKYATLAEHHTENSLGAAVGAQTKFKNTIRSKKSKSSDWYQSCASNVSVGNGSDYTSGTTSSLQQALLQDGYFKQVNVPTSDTSDYHYPHHTTHKTRPTVSTMLPDESIWGSNGRETPVRGGDDSDEIQLQSLSELYENYRIKESNTRQKKALSKHAQWLMGADEPKRSSSTATSNRGGSLEGSHSQGKLSLKGSELTNLYNDMHRNGKHGALSKQPSSIQLMDDHGSESVSSNMLEKWRSKQLDLDEIEEMKAKYKKENKVSYLVGKTAANEKRKIEDRFKQHESVVPYHEQVANHLMVQTGVGSNVTLGTLKNTKGLVNPYRKGMHGVKKGMKSQVHVSSSLDGKVGNPTSYSKHMHVDNHFSKSFTLLTTELTQRRKKQLYDRTKVPSSSIALESPLDHSTRAPTKERLVGVLNDVTKKAVLAYDTRIVEVGACVKALTDIRHPTPGIAAIMQLHRGFIDAASLNPNPTTLTRPQVLHVFKQQVTWYAVDAMQRLISAFDPLHTGMVKYVRLSCSLMACCRPNMSMLAGKAGNASHLPSELRGELLLLKLMHQLYDECDGGGGSNSGNMDDTGAVNGGIRIEDVPELLCSCAKHVDDESRMESMCEDMQALLYIDIQNEANDGSTPLLKREISEETKHIAKVSIKYPLLKSVKGISRVNLVCFCLLLRFSPP